MSKYYSKSVREFIKNRAEGRCEYCQWFEDYTPGPFNIEHILPSVQGGTDSLENLAFSCSGCNGHKSVRTSVFDENTGNYILIYNPQMQIWHEHFTWDSTKTKILGRTLTGEKTVELLQMNRPKLVRLRRAFIALGLHPPT